MTQFVKLHIKSILKVLGLFGILWILYYILFNLNLIQ